MYLQTGIPSECCGCGACADICPHDAITFVKGADGADYPLVDQQKCVQCHACQPICPMQHRPEKEERRAEAYAAVLRDEDNRKLSASGGAFEGIAATLLEKHPDLWIAGAAWQSDLRVGHELLPASMRGKFRKSKYLQSNTVGIFNQVKTALRKGTPVLFTGTPCQVAALKLFLKKEYDILYTVDLICHGVPGASVFQRYTDEVQAKHKSDIATAEFRHKVKNIYGDIHSSYLKLVLTNGKSICSNKKTDPYLMGYHAGLFYRESCSHCPYATPKRYSDLTVGDYWSVQGILPQYNADAGVSCIISNSAKGAELLEAAQSLTTIQTDYQYLLDHNAQLQTPSTPHKHRQRFFDQVDRKAFSCVIQDCVGRPNYLKVFLSRLMPDTLRRKINKLLKG